jgi:hypothetical protein
MDIEAKAANNPRSGVPATNANEEKDSDPLIEKTK